MIMKFKFLPLIFFISAYFTYAQDKKCALYIYSEFDNYNVYIDDALIGTNIKKIDSIDCGEHYIKITYQDIIVFGEILQFNEHQLKKILIKKTKEIEEKLLSSKSKELAEYRRKKISIGINKQYITTTDVQLNQYAYKPLFGNYYGLNYSGNISGVQFSVSEEKITDWFFVEGGYIKMSDYDFIKNYCELTKNCSDYQKSQQLKENILQQNEKIERINKKRKFWSGLFGILFIIGMLMFVWGFIEILVPLFLNSEFALQIFFVGLGMFLIGLFGLGIKVKPYQSFPDKLLSLKDALKMIDDYNAALKKQLDLPDNVD